jgi:hypothetical protein
MRTELDASVEIDEGVDEYGIRHKLILEGDQAVRVQSFDASAMLEECKAERNATSGERWGDGRKIGTIPRAVYMDIVSKYKSADERKVAMVCWLRENTAFVTFDKFLK